MPLAINPLFSQLRFGVLVLAVQLVIIVLFVIFVQYGEQANKDSDAFFNKSHAAYDDVPNYYASAHFTAVLDWFPTPFTLHSMSTLVYGERGQTQSIHSDRCLRTCSRRKWRTLL